MRKLEKHRVKLFLVDLESPDFAPENRLDAITRDYNAIDEDDLDIPGIFGQREIAHDREIRFD